MELLKLFLLPVKVVGLSRACAKREKKKDIFRSCFSQISLAQQGKVLTSDNKFILTLNNGM